MSNFKDKCGIFSAWNLSEAAHRTYLGLFALQHRGQEGAGIISYDGERFRVQRGQGLVSQIFSKPILDDLPGKVAIGHVRYSTAGGSLARNLQPLWVEGFEFEIAIAHNGNLTNAIHLRRELEASGSVFQTSSDTEVILHLMAKAKGAVEERLKAALMTVEGAFSLSILVREKNRIRSFVVKDPSGFRPLALGKIGESYVAASESCAFDLVGAEYLRELQPGEVIEFTDQGPQSWFLPIKLKPAPCIFEWMYFSRPDSVVFGRSVYEMRKKMGHLLAEQDLKSNFRADIVMGVPDSGIPAAIGYAQASGLPFELGLIRNHYIGRTFIEPHQSIRDFGVRIKQNPLKDSLRGKRLVVVDDSLVRGTTSRKINQILRDAGASEIHLRISAPPTISPCYYGIDTPRESELLAASRTLDEIRDFVLADTVRYLDMQKIYDFLQPQTKMCDACFTKNYPVEVKDKELMS